ncbi:MAG: hypothetical protein K0S76_2059 [Herbinix sp.]|jgi:spore germination cell wall hydrolase CwlJ-like protein|nr:hypothetical protein [Herbinix sp.]
MKSSKKLLATTTGVIASFVIFTSTAFAADYKVVPNDTLYRLGILFNTSASSLMSDNKLSSTTIFPGQVLDVPAAEYTVKSGDTLYTIAKKHGIDLYNLRKANAKWDNLIKPGQLLILPGVKPAGSTTENTNSVISHTAEEVNLLARLITAETTGEPYEAMVGVGAVVINRVQSSEWPNTITSVVNQVINGNYQFTPVKNGAIKNTPSDIAMKAARAALNGSDPSKEAIFYYDDSSTNQWILSRPTTVKIGHMVFAK